jgi:CRP-like cAMP-binding protein
MEQITQINPTAMQSSLDRLDFFAAFSMAEKRRILELHSCFVKTRAGEQLIAHGTMGHDFYILLNGRLSVVLPGGDQVLAILEAGSFVGEIAFLTRQSRTANVIVDEESILLRINHDVMAGLPSETREKIKDKVIQKLAERLIRMNQLIAAMA